MTHLTGFCMIAVISSLFSAHVSLGTKMEASREREESIIDHFFFQTVIFALHWLGVCLFAISVFQSNVFSFLFLYSQAKR